MTPDLAELRALAQRANNWGRWARWTDQDGASHMRGLFMVGNLAAVIPIGEMWVETDPDDVNPIAECYTPELADFIAAANPPAVLALLAERDALAAKVERVRDWLDHRGVDASDRDGAYMDGYRAAQRHAVIDAAELRAAQPDLFGGAA